MKLQRGISSKSGWLGFVSLMGGLFLVAGADPVQAATDHPVTVNCTGAFTVINLTGLAIGDTITVTQTNELTSGAGCYYSQSHVTGNNDFTVSGAGTSTTILTVTGPQDGVNDRINFWYGLGSGYGRTEIYVATAPTNANVTINQVTGGTASASPTSIAFGGSTTLTAVADSGFRFVSWSCTGGSLGSASTSVTTLSNLQADVTCTPSFEINFKNYGKSDKTNVPEDRSRTEVSGSSPAGPKK